MSPSISYDLTVYVKSAAYVNTDLYFGASLLSGVSYFRYLLRTVKFYRSISGFPYIWDNYLDNLMVILSSHESPVAQW